MSGPARCTCGSGGHPRECATHPEEYARHVAELDAEWSDDDFLRRVEQAHKPCRDRQIGNCVICDRLGAWVSQQAAEEEIDHLRGALAAWRPIVVAARDATLAYDAQLVPRVPTDMRAIAARSEIAAILSMRAAVRALPPEHRPDTPAPEPPA